MNGRWTLIAWFACTVLPSFAAEVSLQRGDLRTGATIDVTHLEKLSQTLQLTLWAEGPGPLEVQMPKPIMAVPSIWIVREAGLPLREVQANNRQRWSQTYQLSPLQLGPKVPIPLASWKVRAGGANDLAIEWNETMLFVRVESSVPNATLDSLREASNIEPLPPTVAPDRSFQGWFAIVPVCLVLAFILIRRGRRARTIQPPHDAAWAMQELAGNVSADRCAWIVRAYLSDRLGQATHALTTDELLRLLPPEAPWNDVRPGLQNLLEGCDQARFSGVSDEPTTWGTRCQQWIQHAEDARLRATAAPHGSTAN